jgi:hypothetical protein
MVDVSFVSCLISGFLKDWQKLCFSDVHQLDNFTLSFLQFHTIVVLMYSLCCLIIRLVSQNGRSNTNDISMYTFIYTNIYIYIDIYVHTSNSNLSSLPIQPRLKQYSFNPAPRKTQGSQMLPPVSINSAHVCVTRPSQQQVSSNIFISPIRNHIVHSRGGPYLSCCRAFLLAVELIWITAMVSVSRARICWYVQLLFHGEYVRYSRNFATRRQASHELRGLIDRECDLVDELYYWFRHELFILRTCVRFR